jgi:hypothetical protein
MKLEVSWIVTAIRRLRLRSEAHYFRLLIANFRVKPVRFDIRQLKIGNRQLFQWPPSSATNFS